MNLTIQPLSNNFREIWNTVCEWFQNTWDKIEIIAPYLGIAGVAVLVAIVAFFASSETAFLSMTRLTLRQLLNKDKGNKKNTPAKKIAYLKSDTNKLLSLILIGINLITSLASGLASMIASELAGQEKGPFIATVVMVFVLIIFGEITPKTYSAVYPVRAASKFAGTLILLQKIFLPVVWVFARISGVLTKLLNSFFKNEKQLITEEELKSLMEMGEDEGTLEHDEKQMLSRIFDFTDLQLFEVMGHRSNVEFVPADADYEEIASIFLKTGYSRLPVCEESFDNVVGILYYKTVLLNGRVKRGGQSIARMCMDQPLFVPETLTVSEVLQKFKYERVNFAVAVDENGCNSGIVTTDDIMKAVFGSSVHDVRKNEVPAEKRIQPIGPREYIVPGDLKIDDINELLDLDLESRDSETLAGWLFEQFDNIPETGDIIIRRGIKFKIQEQSHHKIISVLITLPEN